MRHLNKRPLIYLILTAFFLSTIIIRLNLISGKMSVLKNSFPGEYEKYGRPVTIENVKLGNFAITTKVTASLLNKNKLEAYVTNETHNTLKVGQRFYARFDDIKNISGKVSLIESKVNLENGLYKVELMIEEGMNHAATFSAIPTLIEIENYSNTKTLSASCILVDKNKYFVWKITGDRVNKVRITLLKKSNDKVMISGNLSVNDQIVNQGHLFLSENQKINIVDQKAGKSL